MHQQLIGYLLCALDDGEQEWIDEKLDRDETCRAHAAVWRRRLGCLETLRPEFEPPHGLAERTCRMVAAFGPAPVRTVRPRAEMSPNPTPPVAVSGLCWHDVIALGTLVLTALALLGPAIDASRFNADLASCQNNMRQLGVAMTQYGNCRGEAIANYADRGRLTAAGMAAVDMLGEFAGSANQPPLCPQTWLAAQGMNLRPFSPNEIGVVPPCPGISVPGHFFSTTNTIARSAVNVHSPTAKNAHAARCWYPPVGIWPGDWRNGTLDGHGDSPPADMAILADDPSADLPGQRLLGHRGQGRNIFFKSGCVSFVPNSAADEQLDPTFCTVESTPSNELSAPIIYVNRR